MKQKTIIANSYLKNEDIHSYFQAIQFNDKTFNRITIYGFGSQPPTHVHKNNGTETEIKSWSFDEDFHWLDISDATLRICDSINWSYE